ncbi:MULTISPECIES: DUF4031 domain-containing protein [unclassified Knoellia]|uniref:DUF4031 domain-containing protein n=1 Tax=Knoellia altitudinis TaxID=3404795 RepID=UPI00360F46C7
MLLIDPPAWPAHGRLWSHLVSTDSYAELHDFADRVGISRRAFEGDHYDIPQELYADVVAAGAVPLEGRELLKRLRDSGLRISKRRHERVVRSTPDAPWLPPGSRADVIASRQDNPPPNTVVVRAAVRDARGLLVVERADGHGPDLPARTVGEGETAVLALASLCADLGLSADSARLLGYVRNVVSTPDPTYPWPTPQACFTVHAVPADGATPTAGSWCPPARQERELGDRHWWPLLNPRAQDQVHSHP